MKPALLFFLLLLAKNLCAQTSIKVEVTVSDERRQPVRGALIRVSDPAATLEYSASTDAAGKATLLIEAAGNWELSVNGEIQDESLALSEGQSGQVSLSYTWAPQLVARKRSQRFEREGFTETDQSRAQLPEWPETGNNVVHVKVTGTDRQPQAGKRVRLIDLAGKKAFLAITSNAGIASFHVPGRIRYDIDVEEHLNAGHLVLEDKIDWVMTQHVTYDTYNITETRRNDTITQAVPASLEARASRALYKVQVSRDGKPWANGNVFLDEIKSRSVFKARTNASGEAVFLLPFGKRFLVHLPYQRDIDAVNLTDARQRAFRTLSITYKPNPALEFPERFVPTVAELMLTEYQNYHHTPYPDPPPGMTGLSLQSSVPTPGEGLLEIGLATRMPDGSRRPPLNISFVIDISGSMAGDERMESLKRGLVQLLRKLRDADLVSLVLFNDQPRLLARAQPVGKVREQLIRMVEALEPSGGTDMLAAMKMAYAQTASVYQNKGANLVVLLTDGYDANPADTLVAAQAPYRDRITCAAIGVGNDYNYDLLRRLVSGGQDLLRQVNEGKELERLFGERLLLLGQPQASDIRINIRYDKDLELVQSYGMQQTKLQNQQSSGRVQDLYAGQEWPVLLSFRARAGSPRKEQYPVQVVLEYRDPATGEIRTSTRETMVALDRRTPSPATMELNRMHTVAYLNDCLLRMARAFERKQYEETGKALESGLQRLRLMDGSEKDPALNTLREKLNLYQRALKNIAYKKKVGG